MKFCKYGIFVAKIDKYALIDTFQGSAGFLDSAANCAALGECDLKATQKQSFKTHMAFKHDVGRFQCYECDYHSATKQRFELHIASQHNA